MSQNTRTPREGVLQNIKKERKKERKKESSYSNKNSSYVCFSSYFTS